ncbi:MAG: ABC transporter permease, partial [Chloroflexota bacterium]|nr:ABC transporter permease [Chloroflexota bacterium]
MDLITATIGWLADPAHWQGRAGIPTRLLEHVGLSAASLAIAIAIALPLGLWIGHTGRGARLAVNLANLGRAIPSLAVMGLVLPVTAAIDPQAGFKIYPTVIAMVVLAAPPILVNAYSGIAGVDRDLVESARGVGMRERQILTDVEIPVALPIVAGGIRSGAVQIVATATLGAIFGGPGLGRYIVEAIAQSDDAMLFAGVVLVAGLSIVTELSFAAAQRRVTSPG